MDHFRRHDSGRDAERSQFASYRSSRFWLARLGKRGEERPELLRAGPGDISDLDLRPFKGGLVLRGDTAVRPDRAVVGSAFEFPAVVRAVPGSSARQTVDARTEVPDQRGTVLLG